MQKKLALLFIMTILCFVPASRACCPPADDYDYSSSMNYDYYKVKPSKIYMPQSLVSICCTYFVKNNLKTIKRLSIQSLPNDYNILKSMFKAVLALPAKDTKRLYKIVTLLKKLPSELYGDLAFLINQHKEICPQDTLIEKEQEELFLLLKNWPSICDDIRVQTIEFFQKNDHHGILHLPLMMHDASKASVPYQVMKVLLNNGASPDHALMLDLAPHQISNIDSKNLLGKIYLVLEFKTQNRQLLKEKVQGLLELWRNSEWVKGNYKLQAHSYSSWYWLDKEATPEEIEKNKQFFIDAIALIEDYEKLEAQEKEDQILPF